jgi:diguanylate cyclase (GGDEF)-like protein
MPNTTKDNARLFAERLRSDIERFYINDAEIVQEKRLTISTGIATFPYDAATKNEIISRADIALYEAKRAGKNRTYLYSHGMGPTDRKG